MNLIVDVGNTSMKLAVFKKRKLQQKWVIDLPAFKETLREVKSKFDTIEGCIISSVGKLPQAELTYLRNQWPTMVLTSEVNLPFQNLYQTPYTLGVDRIALVSAAAVQFPKTNCLIIDAGSCITYDFLTEENNYLGGAISPGINMRYKAMHTFTANLPLLKKTELEISHGDTTEESMHVGVLRGVISEIDGFIDHYQQNYGNLTVILTGGDAHFLRERLKNDIFANSNFLLEGLNYILEIN